MGSCSSLCTYPAPGVDFSSFLSCWLNVIPPDVHASGYANADLNVLDRVEGGSAWGAAAIAAGDGSRQPSETEKGIAKYQVSRFGDERKENRPLMGSFRRTYRVRSLQRSLGLLSEARNSRE
jgi:multimeric flavodoxin WrbA